jgi:hypothetical protein
MGRPMSVAVFLGGTQPESPHQGGKANPGSWTPPPPLKPGATTPDFAQAGLFPPFSPSACLALRLCPQGLLPATPPPPLQGHAFAGLETPGLNHLGLNCPGLGRTGNAYRGPSPAYLLPEKLFPALATPAALPPGLTSCAEATRAFEINCFAVLGLPT